MAINQQSHFEQECKAWAQHIASMVTPKDISRYPTVLKDNEHYLENEVKRFAAIWALNGGEIGLKGLYETLNLIRVTDKGRSGILAKGAIDFFNLYGGMDAFEPPNPKHTYKPENK